MEFHKNMHRNIEIISPFDDSVTPDLDYDVVCGRGKGSYNRPGNKRFRVIVGKHIAAYLTARNKVDKGHVLNSIIDHVKSQNHGSARFIKPLKNGWVEISLDAAREKVGHAIREAIGSRETSVSKEKAQKLWQAKQATLLASQKAIFLDLLAEEERDVADEEADISTTRSRTRKSIEHVRSS
jgi:hypothetical protein